MRSGTNLELSHAQVVGASNLKAEINVDEFHTREITEYLLILRVMR